MLKQIAAVVFFLALCTGAAAGSLEDGNAAYQRGDYAAAIKFWRIAAEQGDALAQTYLGLIYDNGEGVPEDDVEAVNWYRHAAEQGHAAAQYYLGAMYDYGEGVPLDDIEAARWYRLAAEQGHVSAQYDLAVMYEFGEDEAEAVHWYGLAAEQGHADSQFSLSVMYDTGEGVPVDLVGAHMWCDLASAHGHAGARDHCDGVASRMPPDQLAEAQRMAREWLAEHGG